MGKKIAVKYKKRRLFKDSSNENELYIYLYDGIVEPISYDPNQNIITYMSHGKTRDLYDMEDLDFTISDEKSCFSDYMDLDNLKEDYKILDETELMEMIKEECTSFVRFGVFNQNSETLKIVNSGADEIMEAEPDSNFFQYFLSSSSDFGQVLALPEDTIKSMLKCLEEKNYETLEAELKEIENSLKIDYQEILEMSVPEAKIEHKKCDDKTLEQLMEELNKLVGLDNVKIDINKLKKYLVFLDKTKDLNLEQPNLNMAFMGNPGTGKTTVARIVSQILYKLGYAKSSRFNEVTTSDFIAGYVGQTGIKSKKLIDDNKGGVIFIDEAYSFTGKAQEFADEALVEIIKAMESRETIFIFAGYQDEMKNFIDMNPGLKSRIGYVIDFKDYNIEELMNIFMNKINKSNLKITEEAKNKVKNIIIYFKDKDKFGNGRFIDKLFDKIIIEHASNTEDINESMLLSTITGADINDSLYEELDVKSKQKTIGFEGK